MTSWARGFWIVVVVTAACGGTRQAPVPAQGPSDGGREEDCGCVEVQETPAPLCLPVVSGCGCAYVCGTSLRRTDDGSYEIIHDFLDSTTVTAEVQRWCFDEAGHGNPTPSGGGSECRDVFYDRTPCGGECIPSTQFLTCHTTNEGRCVP